MIKHYVEFYHPGAFVSETSAVSIAERCPKVAAAMAPDSAYAFRFFDRREVEVEGEKLVGNPTNESPTYYIGGELMDYDAVRDRVPNNEILLSNMRGNRWEHVVRTRFGNFQPLNEGDQILVAEPRP